MTDLKKKLNIVDFCRDPQLLNLPLLDTQEVLLRQIYQLPMNKNHWEVWRAMTDWKGDETTRTTSLLRQKPHQEGVLILGGRSGKTTLASAISAYEGCCTDWTKYLRKSELAWIFVIATREEQAKDIGRNMIFNMIRNSPYLSSLIIEDTNYSKNTTLLPRSKTGVLVLETGAAITALPCSSRVGRGYPIAVAILDEIAWFARESKNETTDQGVYDAILPRQIQFGEDAKMIIISTPADKSGLLWNKWKDREKNKKLYFCVKIPTWKIRTDLPRSYFERHRKLSPTGFAREYGAEFTDSVSPLLTLSQVEACLRETDESIPPVPDVNYVMGIDAAFGDRDRFAIAIGHVKEMPTEEEMGEFIIDHAEIVEETLDKDLVESAADRIAELFKQYDVFEVYGDEHQADAFGKLLDARGVELKAEPWTASKHRSSYGRLRSLIKQRKISFPANSDLVEELCGLQVKYLPNSGQYTVVHKPGGHDDISDAVAEVVFRLTEDEMTASAGVQFI